MIETSKDFMKDPIHRCVFSGPPQMLLTRLIMGLLLWCTRARIVDGLSSLVYTATCTLVHTSSTPIISVLSDPCVCATMTTLLKGLLEFSTIAAIAVIWPASLTMSSPVVAGGAGLRHLPDPGLLQGGMWPRGVPVGHPGFLQVSEETHAPSLHSVGRPAVQTVFRI